MWAVHLWRMQGKSEQIYHCWNMHENLPPSRYLHFISSCPFQSVRLGKSMTITVLSSNHFQLSDSHSRIISLKEAKTSWWLVLLLSSLCMFSFCNTGISFVWGCPLISWSTYWLLSSIQGVCYLKKDSGPCDQKIEKWFFNGRSNKCEKFTYGGCKGNLNRFATAEKCRLTCKRNADKGKWLSSKKNQHTKSSVGFVSINVGT